MALILNSAGKPEPSPEISRRLRFIHPGLHLRYIEVFDSNWAVCMEWNEEDVRRAGIKKGLTDPDKAFDIVGYIPLTCHVDETPSYLERVFREFPGQEAKGFLDRLEYYNRIPAQEAADKALAEVLDSSDPSQDKKVIVSAPAPKKTPRRRVSKYLEK
jgi:hypothetical protein